MGAWIKRAGLLLGNELKVGAPSASSLSSSGSSRSSEAQWDTASGTFLSLHCVESVLDSFDGLSAQVQDAAFMTLVRSAVVPSDSLPSPVGPIDRLGAGASIVVGNVKSIIEVSCRLSSRADAILFMTAVTSICLVRKNAALALVYAARDKFVNSMRAKGSSTEKVTGVFQSITDKIAGCEEYRLGTDPVDPYVTAGGTWTGNDLSESSEANGDLPLQFFNWQSFKTSRAVGHYVTVEMVDKDMNLRTITRAGGFTVRGLRLQMSPSTLTINSVKLINRGQTLAGWVEEHWGDDLDQVTFSGKSLAFVATVEGKSTLLVNSRADSAAYLEMQALVDLYKTNGLVLYDAEPPKGNERKFYGFSSSNKPQRIIAAHPMRGLVKERFYIRITFDFVTVIGYFESFELVDRAESPYTSEYNLSFKAEQTIYH